MSLSAWFAEQEALEVKGKDNGTGKTLKEYIDSPNGQLVIKLVRLEQALERMG